MMLGPGGLVDQNHYSDDHHGDGGLFHGNHRHWA